MTKPVVEYSRYVNFNVRDAYVLIADDTVDCGTINIGNLKLDDAIAVATELLSSLKTAKKALDTPWPV